MALLGPREAIFRDRIEEGEGFPVIILERQGMPNCPGNGQNRNMGQGDLYMGQQQCSNSDICLE